MYIPILDLSSFHIVSLLYVRTGTNDVLCKNLADSSYKLEALTCNPPPIHHLPRALYLICTRFFQKTHPKYLNSDTCSNRIPSTQTSNSYPSSQPNNITKSLTIALRSSSNSPHKTKTSAQKRSSNLHFLPSSSSPISPLSSLYPYIHFSFSFYIISHMCFRVKI